MRSLVRKSYRNSCTYKRPFVIRLHRKVSDEKIEKALKYARTMLAIEGQYIPKGGEEIIRKRLRKEISHEDFRRAALEMVSRR